ncbi:hypothetical protein R69927_01034 [Paraburkholderia domus]|jgi:hypothetical protein|uniref:Uncharacterized protein n=1 Tax=Paraburkholderia domus TaxID=2793075 RepID=A0A9N8QZL3_9BURK|nr:hypothetical protein [Paraburkholderia domus]MBK5085369.1 hypothetical protein [Burkholderia sp. R-69927]MBK5186395.1 hypothetical protein [Burkholderia sp. R-69749]MCI0152169.1 hypothetical protein [Paraburkholderia sediminicola]CAE6763400.1 hypothetical protein R75483_03667 [Paraburkholderia domus]CAE6802402.1 hypothetical protein R70006_05360 [Paraburkholderia domus]
MSASHAPAVHRSAAELRLAFKTLTAHHLPRVVALDKFDSLWDEVNRAATSASATAGITEYVALLKEMQLWYTEELKGPP